MLRSAKEIMKYRLIGKDGLIGSCRDFLFDDEIWTIRYMVAETGDWLTDRKILISPIALGKADWLTGAFEVKLTKGDIEKSPSLDEDAPVSRQFEKKYHNYFQWTYYWSGVATWGASPHPYTLYNDKAKNEIDEDSDKFNPNLRSINEVTNYHVAAKDSSVGHVEDFILDDGTWTIRYIVLDTRNWLLGKKVLISPTWFKSIDWSEEKVFVDLTKDQIKNSPEYIPSQPVNVEYETRLYDYYGRPHDWVNKNSKSL